MPTGNTNPKLPPTPPGKPIIPLPPKKTIPPMKPPKK